jgi:hypothetical protein
MPTFCRHNRFVQRCPICRETLPGYAPPRPQAKPGRAASPRRRATTAGAAEGSVSIRGGALATGAHGRGTSLRVSRERRSVDDGYRCELVPGLRSSHDAHRLVQEIGFAGGRLLALRAAPPGVYAEARDCEDVEQATWMCFVTAYLSPLQGAQPFAGIRQALACSWASGAVPDLEDVALGPRTSHDPGRGSQTLLAYRRFAEHAADRRSMRRLEARPPAHTAGSSIGQQERAFAGEPEWTPQRRFERAFERLALPGFGRLGRYDLLVTLGWLGLYELRADSLHLSVSARPGARRAGGAAAAAPGHAAGEEATLAAAKRVFGIGDPIHIERRAAALAEAIATPIEALDLALWNWSLAPERERATLGFSPSTTDAHAVERARAALEL